MYRDVYKLRYCGVLRISVVSYWEKSLLDNLEQVGLAPKLKTASLQDQLQKIDVELARNIVTRILWKDLAYDAELMTKEQAILFATKMLDDFYTEECAIYTNGRWNFDDEPELESWYPMTEATFDSGVVLQHPDYFFCVWVEDED